MRRLIGIAFCALLCLTPAVAQDSARTDDGITVPPGFTIETIANVAGAREIAVAANGDLFVATTGNTIYVVPDAQQAKPAAPQRFATFDDRPVAGITIEGDAMYAGGQFGIYKLPFRAGDRTPRGKPEKIAGVRPSGIARDHVTTTVAVSKGVLYASVGSSCNNCMPDLDATRATIQQMHLDGTGMTTKAEHIRNAIALAVNPESGALWAGVAQQDELPRGHPYEYFDDVSAHPGRADYGYPYCYENRKPVEPSRNCANAVIPRVIFPAYITPIGGTFYPTSAKGAHAFPAEYRGGAFVTLHGSWHRPLIPPSVAFVPMSGDEPKTPVNWNDPSAQWHEFVGGLQRPDESRVARPTGIAVGPDGSLFVAEDYKGNIYRIRPKK